MTFKITFIRKIFRVIILLILFTLNAVNAQTDLSEFPSLLVNESKHKFTFDYDIESTRNYYINTLEADGATFENRNYAFELPQKEIRINENFNYFGFDYAGSLYNDETGEVLTGFFIPFLNEFYGKTSLLYVEKPNGKNYWAIYSNNKEEIKFENCNVPKPNWNEILSKHTVDYKKITKLKKKYYQDLFQKQKTPREIFVKDLIDLNFNPIDPNYSGYGIKMITTNSDFLCSDKMIQVGIFKNGKLDGPGFQFKIKNRAKYNSYNKQLEISKYDVDIQGELGLFKEGVLVDGRSYDRKNVNIFYRDYFSKPKNENIHWSGYFFSAKKANFEYFDKEWFSILKGRTIYLEEYKRTFTVTRIDKNTKTIYYQSDVPGVELSVKEGHPGLYAYRFWKDYDEVYCNPYIYVNEYKTVPREYTNVIPSVIVDSRKVATVDGYKVTTTTAKDVVVTTNLGTRQVKTGNKIQKTCPHCNGTGKQKIEKATYYLFEINFNK